MATIFHPLSERDRAPLAELRSYLPPSKSAFEPGFRVPYAALDTQTPAAPGVRFEAAEVGGVPGWWCRVPGSPAQTALLHLHGGAYIVGSASTARHLASQVAVRAGADSFVPDYRLAPEHVFPAAVNDAQAAYRGLSALGYTTTALFGESAGGGLALATLAQAVAETTHLGGGGPVAAAVISPWLDLTLVGESMQTRDEADPLLSRQTLGDAAALYLAGDDGAGPQASPLYGNLAGLPPVRLHVGEDEVLLSDAVRYAEALAAVGGTSELHIWAGMLHVFPASLGTFEASRLALDDIDEFLHSRLRG